MMRSSPVEQAGGASPRAHGEESRVVPALLRSLLDRQIWFLLARMARLLGAPGHRPGDFELFVRMVERPKELAAVFKLARWLQEHSASWLDLERFAEGLGPGLRQLLIPAGRAAREQVYHVVPDIYGRNFHLLQDIREDTAFKEAADRAIGLGRSLLYYDRLYNLYESLRNVSRLYPAAQLNIAEVGVYKGGTSFFLCDLLRTLHAGNARFFSIDTFEGHSAIDLPSGAEGIHGPKEFDQTSLEEVAHLLSEFPFATVIKGRIQECAERLAPGPFHFVHLDVDIYEPTRFSLNLFLPRLVAGGIVCVDDYNKKSCPGVRQAVEEVVAGVDGSIIRLYTQTAQCLLVKTAGVEGLTI